MKNLKVAYVISMANGLDAWLDREISFLRNNGFQIFLCITKYTYDPIFGPEKGGFPFIRLNIVKLIKFFPCFIKNLMNPALIHLAFKNHDIREFFLASYFCVFIKKNNIEHIHSQFLDKKLTVAFYCAKMLSLPLTAYAHSHDVYFPKNANTLKIYLKKCERVFAISTLAKEYLVHHYQVPEAKVILNRLFVEVDQYHESRKLINITIIGRLHHAKGFHYLFEAIRILNNPDIRVHVVGEGEADIKSLAKNSKIEDKIIIWSRLGKEQIRFILSKTDIYCQPSFIVDGKSSEGIPVSLIEAMAAGLPVIVTKIGAIPELVERILIKEKDAGELAKAIAYLIAHPEERDRQGKRNYEIAKRLHSPENAGEFIKNLQSIMNR